MHCVKITKKRYCVASYYNLHISATNLQDYTKNIVYYKYYKQSFFFSSFVLLADHMPKE